MEREQPEQARTKQKAGVSHFLRCTLYTEPIRLAFYLPSLKKSAYLNTRKFNMKKYLTLFLLFIGISGYAQQVKLRLNLQQDSTYYLTTNADMDIDQLLNGVHQKVKTTISGQMAHKVVAIRDTVYELATSYKSLGMHVDVAGKLIDFSTGKDREDVVSKIMNTILDKPFIMTISNRGNVLAVKNTDTLFNSMFANFPQATIAQKAQLMTQMQQSFGEKSIKSNLQDAFVIFSKNPVGVGGTWVTNTILEAGAVAAKTKATYTLDNITDDSYLVHGAATVVPDKTKIPAYKISNGIPMRMLEMAGTSTTKLKIDKKTGWISETNVSKNLKCTIQIKDTPKIPGGLTYPMTIAAVLKMTGK
jgi:hypothetical protein